MSGLSITVCSFYLSKRNAKKSTMAIWEALQIAVKRREVKAKEKSKEKASECRVPKNSKKR